MKKVIFSLKSIALVAMASMAMVSCGGDDDSAPAPAPAEGINDGIENPKGSFKYNGEEYKVENLRFLLHGANNAPAVLNYGTAAEPDVRSKWIGVLYSGEDASAARNVMEFTFTIPAEKTTNASGQTVYRIKFPNEVDAIASAVYAEHKGEGLVLTGLNTGGVTFNTFVYEENESVTDNTSVWGAGQTELLSHTFSGEFVGIAIANLNQSAKGVNASYKMLDTTSTISVQDLKNMTFELK